MGKIEQNNTKLGYARVSTEKQDITNQKKALLCAGIAPEDLYDDIGVSGTVPAKKRKGFKKVYDRIQAGEVDELYIFELSRLGRTSGESIQLFIEIEQKGCKIISLSPNETWTKITDIPGIRNIFTAMFAWFADIERESISERTKLGLRRARAEGKTLGRPTRKIDRKTYYSMKKDGLSTAHIARIMNIPQATLYRWAAKWEEQDRVRENRKIAKSNKEV